MVKELLTDVVTVFGCARELSAYPAFKVNLDAVISGLTEVKDGIDVHDLQDSNISEVEACLSYFDQAVKSLES